MSVYDTIRRLIPNLADDGSKETAAQWLEIMGDASEMDNLLQNASFQRLLASMRGDFTQRMLQLVAKDPELAAMRLMFVRTIGLKGAQEQIERSVQSLVDPTDS